MPSTTVDLCIVVPAHNEEANVALLHERLASVLDAAGIRFRLLFVDDGSRDRTAEVLRGIARKDARVGALRLSRNFGHQAAISIGLMHAEGAAVAVMDADLQDRPEDLVVLWRTWRDTGCDVAYATRRTRKEGVLKRLAYRTFYRMLRTVADIPIPLDAGDFSVMDGAFAKRLNELPERLRFVRGLRAWLGGKQVAVPVDRDARNAGDVQYTFRRLMRLASDGLFSFSDAPLRVASMAGVALSSLAFVGVLVVLAWKAMGKLPSGAGLATIALAVFFFAGVQLLAIGLLGEYIGRIFEEVKGRPVAVVGEQIGFAGAVRSGGIPARDERATIAATGTPFGD